MKVQEQKYYQSDKTCGYSFYCPGCKHEHTYVTDTDQAIHWGFNGDTQNPTFTPSLLNRWGKEADPNWQEPEGAAPDNNWSGRCHLFVTNGKIHYCNDCKHELNGQSIEMIDKY